MKKFLNEFLEWFDHYMWLNSPERKQLATRRLKYYMEYLENGGPNPYLEPDKYDFVGTDD